jgi:two-component system OmpR family sensor kinase
MRTLHTKFFLLVVVLVCANGALALFLQARTYRLFELTMTQALNATLAQTLATEHFTTASLEPQMVEGVKTEFSKLMAVNPIIEIYLLDKDGRIKAFTAPPNEVLRQQVSLNPINDFIGDRFVFPIFGDDPKDPSGQKIFSAALLNSQRPELGFLYVILGGAEYDAVARKVAGGLLYRSVLIVIALGLVVALAVAFFVLRTQTGKLRHLASAIDAFRASQFREPSPVPVINSPRGDELDGLSRAYNEMTIHIQKQMQKIAETDATRRELVSHVSHDLRTPLASLRGYLETLLMKDKTLSAEERRMYLEIAFKQSDHMNRLIEELFELVKLEEVDTRIAPEPFQLGELVQDVIQKFKLISQQRDIVLEGRFAPEARLAHGNVALIERLLDNLLENAISHTPPNGLVTVTVTIDADRARLEVADTGTGISGEDIPHIFERFYRADKSRSPASGGAGLGLAIAKRIVELHDGHIRVHSEVGVGTCFSIELPLEHRAAAMSASQGENLRRMPEQTPPESSRM